MATKPILFNIDMVRALLDGRKTVTRRVVKPQPPEDFPYCHLEGDALWYWTTRNGDDDMMDWWPSYERGIKPPYQTGDTLYVRETWTVHPCPGKEHFRPPDDTQCGYSKEEHGCILYKATGYGTQCGVTTCPHKWNPSIHMPKETARIFLRVTGVRVEQLQDITDDDIVAEGLEIGCYFEEIWDKAIKPADRARYGWAENPWVWVIEFERISGEEALRNE